jgi:uncharacterized membrane protein YjjP (DUF1212 family)
MLDDTALEQNIHALILDLCRVLHEHGYECMNVGAMMRLIGVGEERASQHDEEFMDLTEYFSKNQQKPARHIPKVNSEGKTLH